MSPPAPLHVRLLPERTALAADQLHTLHVALEVTAHRPPSLQGRPPLRVVFALDASASMAGPPMEHVVRAVHRLAELLRPEDHVGVVAFAHRAVELVPLAAATAEHRRLLRHRTARLQPQGGTHLEAGLRRAAALFPPRALHERHVILLLSDGAPNAGLTDTHALAALVASQRPDLSLAALGFGPHHHEDLLSALAAAGGGAYHYIADPRLCDYALARALGQQQDVAAEAPALLIQPAPGVEIERALGGRPLRFTAEGLRVELPDLLDGQPQLTVLRLHVRAPREGGRFELLRAQLTARWSGAEGEARWSSALGLDAAPRDGAPEPEAAACVLLARADEVRAQARSVADRGHFEGAAVILRQLIQAIQRAPGLELEGPSALREALDLLLDEALAYEQRPDPERYQSFRRASLTTAVTSSGEVARTVEAMAGAFPKAALVGVVGPLRGQRVALGVDQLIGRTPSADLCVPDDAVSRSHARVTAYQGVFLLIDLHSERPTLLNGEALPTSHPLRHGDQITVGASTFRYEEGE